MWWSLPDIPKRKIIKYLILIRQYERKKVMLKKLKTITLGLHFNINNTEKEYVVHYKDDIDKIWLTSEFSDDKEIIPIVYKQNISKLIPILVLVPIGICLTQASNI